MAEPEIDLTTQDLLDAIGDWLPQPKRDDEYTIDQLIERWHVGRQTVEEAMEKMRANGVTITERDIISRNGRPARVYRIEGK